MWNVKRVFESESIKKDNRIKRHSVIDGMAKRWLVYLSINYVFVVHVRANQKSLDALLKMYDWKFCVAKMRQHHLYASNEMAFSSYSNPFHKKRGMILLDTPLIKKSNDRIGGLALKSAIFIFYLYLHQVITALFIEKFKVKLSSSSEFSELLWLWRLFYI